VETVFVDGTVGCLRVVEGNETRTESTSDPGNVRDHVPTGQLLKQHLTGVNMSVDVLERNGETYYLLHGATGQRSTSAGLRSRITNYRVTAYITPEGFVATMVVSYDRVSTEGRSTVFLRFDHDRLGEATLEEPEWVGRIEGSTPAAEPGRLANATTTVPESTTGACTSAPNRWQRIQR